MSSLPTLPTTRGIVAVKFFETVESILIPIFCMGLSNVPDIHVRAVNASDYGFLIEHEGSGKKVLFDLGFRRNIEEFPPELQRMLKYGNIVVDKELAEQIVEKGIPLESIDAIIPSHVHCDHIGDPSSFAPSTKLVLGPGALASVSPGYPADPSSVHLTKDYTGREIQEIDFTGGPTIGGFRSYDFFGDGSFYLLDVSGHCVGHMCGFARVGPDSWILMGGDGSHQPSNLRPSKYAPLPPHQIPGNASPILREHLLSHPEMPLLRNDHSLVPHPLHHDIGLLEESINKLRALDAHPDVLMVLAHDVSLRGIVELYPESANRWKEKGWKERGFWAFLYVSNEAYPLEIGK